MSHPVVLVTRPQAQAERFAARLADRLGPIRVVVSPLLAIVPVPWESTVQGVAGLLFTSENGVDCFSSQCDLRDIPVWCVGARTAAAARRAGFATVQSAESGGGDANALLEQLRRESPEGPLLHLRGTHARGDLAERLTASGIRCASAVVYDQPACPLTAEAQALLGGDRPVLLPLFSPRSAGLLADAVKTAKAALYPVAISPAVADAWRATRGENVCIASRPDAAAMVDSMVATWNGMVA